MKYIVLIAATLALGGCFVDRDGNFTPAQPFVALGEFFEAKCADMDGTWIEHDQPGGPACETDRKLRP